jgi:ADYC domain
MGIARITRAIILAMALVGGFWPPARPSGVPGVRSVDVVGTAFRITLDDGRVLTQDELVGVVLLVGNDGGVTRPLRVESVLRDPADPEGDIMLYALSTPDPRTGAWQNICEADADGRRMGFPLRGSWTADGRYLSSEKGFSITCTAGAQGKCVRFGYKPWRTLPNGRPLEPYFQACTRLVRADYCGNGEGHTRDGTPIDIFDRVGIKAEEEGTRNGVRGCLGTGRRRVHPTPAHSGTWFAGGSRGLVSAIEEHRARRSLPRNRARHSFQ